MNFAAALVTLATFCIVSGDVKVSVTKFGMCDPQANYKIKFDAKIKNVDGKPFMEEGSLITDVDIGENVMDTIEVYVFENNKYNFLTKVKESYCTILTKYMGNFSSAMLKAAGLEANTCPIPKGNYKLSNYPLNFNLVAYKDMPPGMIRLISNLEDAKTKESLGCIEMDFTIEK